LGRDYQPTRGSCKKQGFARIGFLKSRFFFSINQMTVFWNVALPHSRDATNLQVEIDEVFEKRWRRIISKE